MNELATPIDRINGELGGDLPLTTSLLDPTLILTCERSYSGQMDLTIRRLGQSHRGGNSLPMMRIAPTASGNEVTSERVKRVEEAGAAIVVLLLLPSTAAKCNRGIATHIHKVSFTTPYLYIKG